MVERVHVWLGSRSYDIMIGEGVLSRAGDSIAPLTSSRRAFIVTDEIVALRYLRTLTSSLSAREFSGRAFILPPGEQTKSFTWFERLVDGILSHSPDRGTPLIALGGGVIGDLTGFAASATLRGLDFIQIPTTLLSQVDSSVGGKTGINARYGKNLIGAFYQPKLVLADVSALSSLPVRELRSGYAEVLKYGLIDRPHFFHWLESHGHTLLEGNMSERAHAIAESCRAKATIVAADERENGRRALLNFGHTFAHALEAETGFSDTLLHGEAVAIGMALAIRLSARMGLCPEGDVRRVLLHYAATGLLSRPSEIHTDWNIDALMQHFTRDKKVRDGRLTFVLSRGIGRAFVTQEVDPALVRQVLIEYCA